MKRAPYRNYRVHLATFRVRRDVTAPDPRLITDAKEVAALARDLIPDDAREHFLSLMLNTQNVLVAAHHVATGTLNSALVHPREIIGPALRMMGVAAIVLVHNHPSGDPTPSREDLRLTSQIASAMTLLDLRLHDHVILGNGSGSFVSFAERGLLA